MRDDPEILSLSAEIDAAEEVIRSLKAKLGKLKREKAGVEIGMIVKATGHRNAGQIFRVTKCETWMDGGRPWLHGCRARKEGGFTTHDYPLYSHWERVS